MDSNCTRNGCDAQARYRAPDHESYKGRGDWADKAADMLLTGEGGVVDQCAECRTPPGCEHNAECPTGEDVWPLTRDGECGDCGEGRYMSEDKPVDSHMLSDAMCDMSSDAGKIIHDAIERGMRAYLPRADTKAGLPTNPLHAHMRETFYRCLAISVAKNQDYASSDDPFKNFRRAEMAGVSVEQGILVRLTDKLCRIGNLLEHDAAVKDERIGDTINDMVNYAAILRAWLEIGG